MEDIVIVSAVRTAIGKFGGSLAKVPAVDLGATVIKEALQRANVPFDQVGEVIMGPGADRRRRSEPCTPGHDEGGCCQGNTCPDHQCRLRLGPEGRHAGGAGRGNGDSEIVVAGGQENMSLSPHVLKGSRDGQRMGTGRCRTP